MGRLCIYLHLPYKSSIHVGKYQFHGSYGFGSGLCSTIFFCFYIRKSRGNDPSFTVALPIYTCVYTPQKKNNMSPEKGPCLKENSLPTIMLVFWGVLYLLVHFAEASAISRALNEDHGWGESLQNYRVPLDPNNPLKNEGFKPQKYGL